MGKKKTWRTVIVGNSLLADHLGESYLCVPLQGIKKNIWTGRRRSACDRKRGEETRKKGEPGKRVTN